MAVRGRTTESIPFERLQEDVHRLPGYEGTAGQIGVGQARSLSEELKARVLRHRHPQWAQRTVHRGAQHTVRLLEEIAQRGVQVYSSCRLDSCQYSDIPCPCQCTDITRRQCHGRYWARFHFPAGARPGTLGGVLRTATGPDAIQGRAAARRRLRYPPCSFRGARTAARNRASTRSPGQEKALHSGSAPPTPSSFTMLLPGSTRRSPRQPIDGPFGRTFTFADPDGYRITIHDGA